MKKETKKLRPFKLGQILELTVTRLNQEGLGVAESEGNVVLVRGALPGELVRVKVTFVGRRDIFSDVVKVLRRSPVRLASPACNRGVVCDGCPLIQMQYQAQLEWKKELVEGHIHSYTSLRAVPVHPVIPSEKHLGYRNSAKLVVGGKFLDPLIGIYHSKSHDITDIADCPLHHPLINRIVSLVKEGIKKGKVPIYSRRTGSGILRYLVVRVSEAENKAMVVFVTYRRSFNEIHHLAKYLQSQLPEVAVVAQNVNSSAGNVILGENDFFVTKQHVLAEKIGNTRFLISPRSFFQINNSGARAVYEKVMEMAALSGKETVLDIYCGVGGISLFLAPHAKEVIGLETVGEAVADAEKNARLNSVRNCRFEAGDAAELVAELVQEEGKAEIVVLNPPRRGCDEKVLRSVSALKPQKLIYVSCSPQTLSRDLDVLTRLGYVPHTIQPVDMFPQTPHVENVVLLLRKGSSPSSH